MRIADGLMAFHDADDVGRAERDAEVASEQARIFSIARKMAAGDFAPARSPPDLSAIFGWLACLAVRCYFETLLGDSRRVRTVVFSADCRGCAAQLRRWLLRFAPQPDPPGFLIIPCQDSER